MQIKADQIKFNLSLLVVRITTVFRNIIVNYRYKIKPSLPFFLLIVPIVNLSTMNIVLIISSLSARTWY